MPTASALLSIEQAQANIARDNARLNIVMDRESAPLVSNGHAAGLLRGFSVAVKANIAVRGLPFTAGIGAFRQRIADKDAAVVGMLREAGATIIGTVNMEEAALGATTDNPHFGRTENPHRAGFTAGGSSGGSAAAVAARFARIALGTDTMGSCRIPAAYCGVVGYKPSYGLISVNGVEPLSCRLDHVGILATTVADIRAIADVICRFDRDCAWSVEYPLMAKPLPVKLNECRFAILDGATIQRLQPAAASAYRYLLDALRAASADLVENSVDQTKLAAARRAGLLLCESELAVTLAPEFAREDEGLSENLRRMISFGKQKSAPDLVAAGARIDAAILVQRQLLDGVDALLWPTVPHTAFAFGEPVPTNQADFTCLANFTGAPALSLPLPVEAAALPVGVQIMTTRGTDARLLDISLAIEQYLSHQ